MSKETKVGIAAKGVVLLAIAGMIASGGGVVKIDKDIALMTMNNYRQLKAEMIQKYENDEIFTWQELEVFNAVLNHEAKKGKFKELKEVTKDNLIRKLIKEAKVE